MSETTLFSINSQELPLPERARPKTIDEISGQKHFLNESFKRLIKSDRWVGFIFWGPPGVGKTTLSRVIAQLTARQFHSLSAVISGVKEIREVLEDSQKDVKYGKKAHILFIDEVHRLNKAQQDILLPFLEMGTIRFIGASTENPSFEINNAVSSRCLIFHFNLLSEKELIEVLERIAPKNMQIGGKIFENIASMAAGDARRAIHILEHLTIIHNSKGTIESVDLEELGHSQSLYYDKKSEGHYDTISAFIKSVRGSDPSAAVYYLARMLEGGEDPLFIARRLIILAAEDIGNANPLGLIMATQGYHAVHNIGMPEARIVLSQVATFLSSSEKSNRSYLALEDALKSVKKTGHLEIPYAIRNAPTSQMKDWGYGKGYQYAHDFEGAWTPMQFLPDELKDLQFYKPSKRGYEKKFFEFLKERGNG